MFHSVRIGPRAFQVMLGWDSARRRPYGQLCFGFRSHHHVTIGTQR